MWANAQPDGRPAKHIFAIKAFIDNRKKLIKQQYVQ